MRNSILIILFLLASTAFAQEPPEEKLPPRTAEEEALKQTERLTRELDITDTLTRDTLYRLHLKYAVLRHKGLTRAENLQYMQQATEELKQILSPEQFDRFMNHRSTAHPRMPQPPMNRLSVPEDLPDTTRMLLPPPPPPQ